MRKLGLAFALIFKGLALLAQPAYVFTDRLTLIQKEAVFNEIENTTHTACKPFLSSFTQSDSLNQDKQLSQKNWFYRKLFNENLFEVGGADYSIAVNPVFNGEIAKDLKDNVNSSYLYTNTRGLRINGYLSNQFSFETSFYENQSIFPNYISDYVKKYQVVPGQGRVKPFKDKGFDYAMASALFSYSPVRNLNFTFGHGKNFIGEGYRSMLLSDNAFNYPFLKFGYLGLGNKLQYQSIYASLQSLQRSFYANTPEALFLRKLGTFHYLSLNVNKRLQLGLFEGIIWKASENNYAKSPSLLFYNPLPFLNSFILANDTNNNVLSGINLKYKIFNKTALYGQFAIDNFKKQRYAYQIGLKSFECFGIKPLSILAEYNMATKGTYAFGNSMQNYSHYNQALAHPIGTGFSEAMGIINYRFKSFYSQLKFNYILSKKQAGSTFQGYDIFMPDEQQSSSAGVISPEKYTVRYQDIELGYLFNQKTNLKLGIGLSMRHYKTNLLSHENQIFYVSFSSSLLNRYYDF